MPPCKRIALVGNPNCGKTTLFNRLTGAAQRVGNWPGVTVERKSGYFSYDETRVEVIDLPGVYSLTLASETAAIDERIACDFIMQQEADLIINILDASHLERHLYLSTQLLEMGVPLIIALNMMDVARARHIHIDIKKLSETLGCPVIVLTANKGTGIEDLKKAIVNDKHIRTKKNPLTYPAPIKEALDQLAIEEWKAIRLLEEDVSLQKQVSADLLTQVSSCQEVIRTALKEDPDILFAEARYQFIKDILCTSLTRTLTNKKTWTTYIDNIVLHRVLGIPIFLGVMYCLFLFSINIGGAFQDFFDLSSEAIFVNGFAYLLGVLHSPTWLTALLANGIGKGINTTITFIPVIGAMFLFLALLEDSGYMARAAFVIDRFMRALGLPGKAFVPMIVGFGCNVPGIMAARTLENKRDRILTIMMSPFMSCGARLAIYAVFTAAFFPRGGQNVVFALYLIGIAMAILTGFILRKTLLKGEPSLLIIELPPYHFPQAKTLFIQAWQRLKGFVFRAGKLIVPICVLIGVLNTLNIDGTMNTGDGSTQSLLSAVGQYVTPIFAPMGLHVDNWPATVGLVTGILAKEVVVGTLNTLYSQMGHFSLGAETFHFWDSLWQAVKSIPENFAALSAAFSNPVLAKAPIETVNSGVYGLMYQKFDGKIGAFAYLLFILLYFPCISTTAAMLREVHKGWSFFSPFWMTSVAYGVAVIFYQAATLPRHPLSSCLWIIGMFTLFFGTLAVINLITGRIQNTAQQQGELT